MKRKQIGDEIREPVFVEPPSPVPRRKKRVNYEEEEDEDSDAASVASRVSTTTSQNWRTRRNPPTPSNRTVSLEPPEIRIFQGIQYRQTAQFVGQRAIRTARPNIHLSKATKDVVLHIIKRQKQVCYDITFPEIIKRLVNGITNSLFGENISSMAGICSKIEVAKDSVEREALSICVSLQSLVLAKDNECPKVKFDTVLYWCRHYCTILSQALCGVNQRIDKTSLKTSLQDEYSDIIKGIDREVSEHFQSYKNVFIHLGNTSDWCLYSIFGLSLNERGDGIDTSVLVKSVLVSWALLDKMPFDLTADEITRLKKIYWCLPLAHLTGLGGFGKPDSMESTGECNIEEFMDLGTE